MKTATARTALAFAAVLVVLHSSSVAPVHAGSRVTKVRTNGAEVRVGGTLDDGCTSFDVYAAKGGTASAPTTFLYYDVYDSCAGQSVARGEGQVANSALIIRNKGASLNVRPTNTTNFVGRRQDRLDHALLRR